MPLLKNDTQLSPSAQPFTFSSRSRSMSEQNINNEELILQPYVHRCPIVRNRLQRLKVEMCWHIVQGNECPFGSACTYAHRPSELQVQYLKEKIEAGEINGDTYRNKPCFDHVATGACPYGNRCCSIHDPAVEGRIGSWLPRINRRNGLPTDLHVDWKSFYNFAIIQHSSPFGRETNDAFSSFEAFGMIVRNDDEATLSLPSSQLPGAMLQLHRLEIALRMYLYRPSSSHTIKYTPSHFVFDRLCMIAQVRAFSLVGGWSIIEIPLDQCVESDTSTIIVHELIFGQNLNDDEIPPSLWFNIPSEAIVECCIEDQLRYNRERSRDKERNSVRSHSNRRQQEQQPQRKRTGRLSFELGYDEGLCMHHTFYIPSFILYYPEDEELYNLITSSLRLDIDTMRNSISSQTNGPNGAIVPHPIASFLLHDRRAALAKQFKGLKFHFLNFSKWPKSKDREEEPSGSTPLPDARRDYLIQGSSSNRDDNEDHDHVLYNNSLMWHSFLQTLSAANSSPSPSPSQVPENDSNSRDDMDAGRLSKESISSSPMDISHSRMRLRIFQELEGASALVFSGEDGSHPQNVWNLPLLQTTPTSYGKESSDNKLLGLDLKGWDLIQTHYKNK